MCKRVRTLLVCLPSRMVASASFFSHSPVEAIRFRSDGPRMFGHACARAVAMPGNSTDLRDSPPLGMSSARCRSDTSGLRHDRPCRPGERQGLSSLVIPSLSSPYRILSSTGMLCLEKGNPFSSQDETRGDDRISHGDDRLGMTGDDRPCRPREGTAGFCIGTTDRG